MLEAEIAADFKLGSAVRVVNITLPGSKHNPSIWLWMYHEIGGDEYVLSASYVKEDSGHAEDGVVRLQEEDTVDTLIQRWMRALEVEYLS